MSKYQIENAFSFSSQKVFDGLLSSPNGLSQAEQIKRLAEVGSNTLPEGVQQSLLTIFVRQFLNPLIYVLLFAALLSLIVGKIADMGFILAVLALNAIIGAIQERSAQQSAQALQSMVSAKAKVLRDEKKQVVQASELVPGDVVLLESGDKIPADMRLFEANNLQTDESLLTGESMADDKNAEVSLDLNTPLADQINMAFSGTLVVRGRAKGIVTATGVNTEVGKIASDVLGAEKAKPPLIQRMERFTWGLTILMLIAAVLLAALMLIQSYSLVDVLLVVAALAVAAIPEGLPVAITIALSVSMRRMAKRHVIARRLVTVEALGSCTFIASDKTGTLTQNQISLERIVLPQGVEIAFVDGDTNQPQKLKPEYQQNRTQIEELLAAGSLANEGELIRQDDVWVKHGDSADVAFLVTARNNGVDLQALKLSQPRLALIPFESENRFMASLHKNMEFTTVYIKGAVETLLGMCNHMQLKAEVVPLEVEHIHLQAEQMAHQGYRVLALAAGRLSKQQNTLDLSQLKDMRFLGLVGLIDPLRSEAFDAVRHCRSAGIDVAMLTGDHPVTAFAIAHKLGLVDKPKQVISGAQLIDASEDQRKKLLAKARVYARMEPHQKLLVVNDLQESGHFVAVTGDGANDAPALKAAHVGVAMGQVGTDVARETADMIITDDNFSSIVAGIEEGRIAYNNVRKVVHLLISTGAGEIVLFFFSILFALPIPLTAIQLLWLNLVTNGIQHVALAFEPGEGNELQKPPRKPKEPIFNRIMIERVVIAAVVIGLVACFCFYSLLSQGLSVESARNGTLFLMVLFENIHVFNSRSETQSVFWHNPLKNKLLLFGTLAAQAIHLLALYTPGLSHILQVHPISFFDYVYFLSLAIVLLIVSEIYKVLRKFISHYGYHNNN